MRYSALSSKSRQEMLAQIGVSSVEDLLTSIPEDVRLKRDLKVEGPLAEADLRARLEDIKAQAPRLSFLGAGLYDHFVPATLDSLAARSEWVTSYTPYQAELAQGTLTMYYEFQTYIAKLTGQEIANGGMYDGSTSLVEAILMAQRIRPRAQAQVLVSQALHPDYRAVLNTYMRFAQVEVIEVPFDQETGRCDWSQTKALQADAIAVVVQSPNFFGVIEDLEGLDESAFTIGVCTEAMSLALLQPLDVDIAVGECQSFGIPMQLGGPTAGYFATRKEWVRKMPGRLVGRSEDQNGEEAYCITLATREQFIRREKATSNICTSSGLMCLRSTIYLSLLGGAGLRRLAEQNAKTARYFAKVFEELGFKTRFSGTYFNEFVLDCSSKPELYETLLAKNIIFGLPLADRIDGMKDQYLVAFTETHYRQAEAIAQEIRELV